LFLLPASLSSLLPAPLLGLPLCLTLGFLGLDALQEHRGGLVAGVLPHQLAFKGFLEDALAQPAGSHVRARTAGGLRLLFDGLPIRVVRHTQVFPGYKNIVARAPALGQALLAVTYALACTLLCAFSLSHLLGAEQE
jgi:hypothetical protein